MNVKVLPFVMILGVVAPSGCVSTSPYVVASDERSAIALAARVDEERIQREKRGVPPEAAKTWREYWKDRLLSLERLSEHPGLFAKPSLESIAYIRRRRAEEGLPPY